MTNIALTFKWSRWDHMLALGFGAGLSPVAPGTVGTLVAIPLYWGLKSIDPELYLAAIVLGLVAGVYVCSRVAHDLGQDDHPAIVWDEVIGYWVAMLGAPLTWQYMLLGFVLFRLLDIWKPGPIAWVEKKTPGGLGVMLDDLLAGIVAALGLNFLAFLSTNYFDLYTSP
ncbi:MAG: phosphatidylglycerophosphatase A family protein [Methylohalobius sp. ZOD2]